LQDPVPAEEARRALLVLAAGALGVGTALDLRQYVGIGGHNDRFADAGAKPATLLAELVEEGRLEPCTVEGWDKPAFRDPAASTLTWPPRWRPSSPTWPGGSTSTPSRSSAPATCHPPWPPSPDHLSLSDRRLRVVLDGALHGAGLVVGAEADNEVERHVDA